MMECLDLGPPLMFIVKLYNFFLAFCSFKLQHGWEGTCARKPKQSTCWSKQPMNKFNRSMLKNRVGIFEMTVADNWRKPNDISCICTAPIWKPRGLQLCFYRSLQFFTHCRSMCNIQMILWDVFVTLWQKPHRFQKSVIVHKGNIMNRQIAEEFLGTV